MAQLPTRPTSFHETTVTTQIRWHADAAMSLYLIVWGLVVGHFQQNALYSGILLSPTGLTEPEPINLQGMVQSSSIFLGSHTACCWGLLEFSGNGGILVCCPRHLVLCKNVHTLSFLFGENLYLISWYWLLHFSLQICAGPRDKSMGKKLILKYINAIFRQQLQPLCSHMALLISSSLPVCARSGKMWGIKLNSILHKHSGWYVELSLNWKITWFC